MFSLIKLECGRNLDKTGICVIAVFMLLAMVILQVGIEKYKPQPVQKKEFIEVEARKIQRYINFMQFGIYGFRRLLESSPLMAMFYNSTTLSDLQAFIDSGVRLKFSKPEAGKNLFERPTGGTLDFSWYLLIPASLIVAPWGFFTFRNRAYIHYLMNFTKDKHVYWGIMLGRILIIITVLAITTGTAFFQFLLNGIVLNSREVSGLLVFLLLSIVVMVFLLVFSAGFGARQGWVRAVIVTVCSWLIFVMLWPEVLNIVIAKEASANMKSMYKHEIQKTEKLMEFEREALKRTGRYDTVEEKKESDRQMAEYYWNYVSKDIDKLEFEMIEKSEENARKFHFCSIFNPVTFYKSVNNELSSKGYNMYMKFYRGNKEIQKGFLRFYFDRRFYENYSKVEPYLAAGENIFPASPSLPAFFVEGLAVSFLYIVIGLFFSYFRFKCRVYPYQNREAFQNLKIMLKKGIYITLNVFDQVFTPQFLKVFWGKCQKFIGQVTLDGKSIVNKKKKVFAYIPSPGKIPGGIKVSLFVTVLAGLLKPGKDIIQKLKAQLGNDLLSRHMRDLSQKEIAGLLLKLAQLKQPAIYIIHDLLKDMPECDKSEMMDTLYDLKNSGCLTIDIISGSGVNIIPDMHAQIVCRHSTYEMLLVKNIYEQST